MTSYSASSRLRVCYPVVSALNDLLDDESMDMLSTSDSDRAIFTARGMAQDEIDRTQPEVTRLISNHEAKPCRELLRDIEGRLPIELRKMVYGFIWQDQRVQLDTCKEHHKNRTIVLSTTEPNKRTRWPYDCLLKPKYFTTDDPTRLELVKAWYESSTFLVKNPALIDKSLEKFRWGTNLRPRDHIKNVEMNVRITGDTAEQAEMARKVQLLKCSLNWPITFTIILENLQERIEAGDSVEDYMGNAACMFPTLRNWIQPHLGFRPIIRSRFGLCNIKFVVVREEITVQDWTDKVEEATRRFALE